MKKSGYTATFAGAVEAVASTGSMIMPPVMGSAAFIMASFMGVAYSKVALAALIPAILYYLAIYLMVDFRSAKDNIKGLPREECPRTLDVIKNGWYMLLPLVVIIVLMVLGFSATMSAVWATLTLIALSFISKDSRITPNRLLEAIIKSVQSSLSIAMYCAAAGLVCGAITQSGLALRISNLILSVAGNSLIPALLITAVVSILLGMGLTTPIVYITVSTLFVPALIKLGIEPMAANMFALYFGIVSNVTPPVALASYAAAGISGADPMKTAFQGFFLGIVAFIVPFAFVYNPELLFIGTSGAILQAFVSASIGCVALAAGIIGWLKINMAFYFRIALMIAGVCMIWPGTFSDLIGIAILGLILLYSSIKAKKSTDVKEAI
jgi:TRAP transporter 4TM/12TM fusion protein